MSQLFLYDGEKANCFKPMIATVVYENPAAAYTQSIQKSSVELTKRGINFAYTLLTGNAHVDDGRNSVVKAFLESDCTDLVFIDADVAWEPEQLMALLSFEGTEIVGGVYPYRSETKGDNMPVSLIPGESAVGGLLNVEGLPTGFMRISRNVLEVLYKKADKYDRKGDRGLQMPIIFERTFANGKRYGGDISFCRKWKALGGKVQAATELHLGHVAKSIIWDSLGASLRRQNNDTLKHTADLVKANQFTPHTFSEARRYLGNHWGALEDVLMMCAILGSQADGDIIETGSGLTSIVLGAASKHKVYCIEHDPYWHKQIVGMLHEAGVDNVEVILCPVENGWYEVPEWLNAKRFALGLNDGPPRTIGSRTGFFKQFGEVDTIICDDADDEGYGEWLSEWSKANGRRLDFVERSALIRRK